MLPAGPLARSQARKIPILAILPVLAFLVYWCVRLAWADYLARTADVETVARAVRLSPGDTTYRLRLADVQQVSGKDPTAALEAAVALEPGNATAWIRLGTSAEVRGDLRAAEIDLLQAARVSRQFAPRWALANYYFRRGDGPHFWQWTRESLGMSYGDLIPVFQLCWHMSQDADQIYTRAIPERRDVLSAYLQFLTREGRLAAAEPVALKLAALATADDQGVLLWWCNRQLDAGAVPATVEVWNTLCARRLLPYTPLDPDRAPLTDGGFAAQFVNSGFAWRLPAPSGVSFGRNPSPRYVWFTFSGDQPEACAPLLQFVPVTPGASYRLRFEYQTSDLPSASGLRWAAFDARTGVDLTASSPWLASASWKGDEMRFTAPSAGLARVTLTCRRLPGAMRIQGTLELRGLSIERQP